MKPGLGKPKTTGNPISKENTCHDHGWSLETKKTRSLQFKKTEPKDVGKNTEYLKKVCARDKAYNKTRGNLQKI